MPVSKQIGSSELILNPDGSIYHLAINPEEVADIIINVGDPGRVRMVSSFFDHIEVKREKREFITHTGTYKGTRLSVISTGIGTDNIDIVYNELDALANIDLKTREIKDEHRLLSFIRIGTTGSLQEYIRPDTAVSSEFGLGLDGLMLHYKYENNDAEKGILKTFLDHYHAEGPLPHPYIFGSSGPFSEHFNSILPKGITASCQGFYGPQGRVLRLQPKFPGLITSLNNFKSDDLRITNFEMETSAMFGLARLLGHDCCSVNLVVANRITNAVCTDYKASMNRTIELVLESINEKTRES
jgi:uridine phosphorylase